MAAEHPLLAEALASLDRAVIEASEAEEKLDAASDALSFDPARLDSIETRLFDLRGLARKHRVEPAQLGALYREMTEKLTRSEEHTSELQSLMRISYAVFCLKKNNITHTQAI